MFPRHSFKELIDLEALVNVTVWKKDQFSPSQQPNQFYRSSCIINTCSLIKIHLGLGVVVTVCLFNSITYLITSEYLQIQFPFTLSWTRAKNASAAELTFPLFPGITPATWSVFLFAHTSTISHCCLLRAFKCKNNLSCCPLGPDYLLGNMRSSLLSCSDTHLSQSLNLYLTTLLWLFHCSCIRCNMDTWSGVTETSDQV